MNDLINELKCPECSSHNITPTARMESFYWCENCGAPFEKENEMIGDANPYFCEHKYVHGGVRYVIGRYKNPEYARLADADPVFYYELYFCEKCLNKRFEKMPVELDTYASIRYDALPMSAKDSKQLKEEEAEKEKDE